MAFEIAPGWDPTGTVRLRLERERGELVVSDGGELTRFVLRQDRPARLGWAARRGGRGRDVRVSVGEVVCHCLRQWEAEQEVLALSRAAAERARARGGRWRAAGAALRKQCSDARRSRRLAALPFQKWWAHLSAARPGEGERLTLAVAALRAGYRMPDGRADTVRLLRRLGLAEGSDGRTGARGRSRFVNYQTGLALCRALDRDPVELGL